MMVTCVLILAAAPALGASFRFDLDRGSRADYDDCNAPDPGRNIAGCTRIIDDPAESTRNRAIAHVGRGIGYFIKGAYDRAIADYDAAISIDKAYINLAAQRGSAWYAKGDLDHAISDFDLAIRLNPKNDHAYYIAPPPGSPSAIWTAPSPTSRTRSASTRKTPSPTTAAAESGARRGDLDPRHRRPDEGDRNKPAAGGFCHQCRRVNVYVSRGRAWYDKGDFCDGLIAEEVSDLRESCMAHADAMMADEDIVATVYETLAKRHPKSRCRGRRGAPADMVLRSLILKHIRN
jgi:tetratricopeptide (TPR) repeat protein